jgi:hypothetical protein
MRQRVFTQRPEVARMQTSVIFQHHAGGAMPSYLASDEAPRERRRRR